MLWCILVSLRMNLLPIYALFTLSFCRTPFGTICHCMTVLSRSPMKRLERVTGGRSVLKRVAKRAAEDQGLPRLTLPTKEQSNLKRRRKRSRSLSRNPSQLIPLPLTPTAVPVPVQPPSMYISGAQWRHLPPEHPLTTALHPPPSWVLEIVGYQIRLPSSLRFK